MTLTLVSIGKIIRELRKKQAMTGVALGKKTAISQSKISKIENGTYGRLSIKEIELILNILKAPHTIRQQVSHSLQQTDPLGFIQKPYNTIPHNNYDLFETNAELIELSCIHTIPALLQTLPYRIAVLQRLGVQKTDMPAFLKETLKRQGVLWGDCKLKIIIHESTLYSIPEGKRGLHTSQMDRLKWFIDMPNMNIGIVPTEAGWPLAEAGPFAIYDRKLMFTATAHGDIRISDVETISLYTRIFAELQQIALYNDEAKRLIDRAIAYYS